jgi:hypothetical protein
MNKKLLNSILKHLQKSYPFIKDIKWEIIYRSPNVHNNFTIYTDMDMVQSLFPYATIDDPYLFDNRYLMHNPTMGFNEYNEHDYEDLTNYGDQIQNIVEALLNATISSGESYNFLFNMII